MKKVLLLLTSITFLFMLGCASNLSTSRISNTPIDSSDKTLVLLNSSTWDIEIKKTLIQSGFSLKNMPSVLEVQKDINDTTSVKYNKAEARYGIIQHPGRLVDWCLYNKNVKFGEFTLEVVDLRTNESILLVSKGGWTGDCFPSSGTLFQELTQALRQNWK